MDETPMTFDMAGFRTVNKKGDKTVSVKTTGSEKAHFTVKLSCLADETKLPVMIIFKRKMPKDKLPSGVIVVAQEKGWVDKNLLQQWLLLHVRFRITTGSAFLWMKTTIQILRDFKPMP